MTTGLILEGGGMRGVFVTGVIDYLLENEIKFDNVIEVSAGACHGCSFVSGQQGRAFHAFTDHINDKEYASFLNLMKTGNFFGEDFIYHRIPDELYPIDNEYFKSSGVKFQAVVTNCKTGEAEYPIVKDLFDDIDYLLASSSLPLLAKMVELDGNVYMDGGICDSIPLKKSIEQGNQKNLVVLTRNREYRKGHNKAMAVMRRAYRDYPNLIRALENRHIVYNETLEYIFRMEEEGKAFVIAPMGPLNIKRTEKNIKKLEMAYREGYFVAQGLGDKLKAYLQER